MGGADFWGPAAMGGLGALGGALGGAASEMTPFGQKEGHPDPMGIGEWSHIFPPTLLANYLSNVEQAGAIATARAAQPVTLPGTQIQQPGWYGGGGMVMPVGLSGMDVANIRPSILGVPGVRFGQPDPQKVGERALSQELGTWSDPRIPGYNKKIAEQGQLDEQRFREHEMAKWMFPGAPRETPEAQLSIFERPFSEGGAFQAPLPASQGLRQPSPTPIQPGGGFHELFGALKLLGVETDPMGNLTMGSEYPLFTGAERPEQYNQATDCAARGGTWNGTRCVFPTGLSGRRASPDQSGQDVPYSPTGGTDSSSDYSPSGPGAD